ncbi:uncharacterized protein [Coffea arabica]|uniref:Reverse transcriptase domain-containing protein n=1 Tax=Coffea arabica TaxID=13443 RepID=A0ABM4WQ35_COFAR
MKPTRSRSRKALTIGVEQSNAAQQEDISEGQESPRTQPANEEAITRMAEFVTENPNIFEELGRYLKRQGKQNAESSKRKSVGSPEGSSEEESDGRRLSRSASKKAFSKATSKRAPPFTDDINEKRLPPNFKLPSIPSYDGRGDPEDHIHAFISAFRLYCIPDPVICRAFPIFLQGTARKWFWGLELRSISTLGELVEKFLHRFVSSRPTTRTSAYLLNMQQNPGESLRSYVQRFHEESVQIPNPNEQVTIAAFTHGLVVGVFNTGIHKKYPHSLHELWLKVEKGIQTEDLNRMKKEVQTARPKVDPRKGKDLGRSEVGSGSAFQSPDRDRRSIFDRISKGKPPIPESELIPLNTTRSRVLSVMEQNNLGKAPPKMFGSRDKRNSNLYSLYHRDIGHETENCNDLKREIENLIRQGHLKQFIRRGGGQPRNEPRRDNRGDQCRDERRTSRNSCRPPKDPRETKRLPRDGSSGHELGYRSNIAGVINTIAGGPTGGDSQNSRKSTYRQANPDQTESSSRLSEVISYGPGDPVPAASSSHEALVIEVLTNNYIVKKVDIDPGSSVDVMYLRTFDNLKLARESMTPVRTPLVGFGGHVVHPEWVITLTVTVGHHLRCRTIPVNFVVVKADSPYNLLLDRPTLNALRAVYSTYHLSFKFPTPAGVAEVSSDVCAARKCYLATLQAASPMTSDRRSEKRSDILSIDCLDPQQAEKFPRLETGDEMKEVSLSPTKPNQIVRIGIRLPGPIKKGMVDLLREYRDVFAWAADEAHGVPHHLMIHELNVDPQARPVKQKRRHIGPKRSRAVGEEVDKLLPAKIIREVQYPIWLSNPVMVKKDAGAWRMCVDFTDLNKTCPKDYYPLPKVDTLVDSAMGYEVLCFLDVFKGYHQIGMSPEDQEKTTFYTDRGTYCYTTMPFGLKNAGAMYQRLVNQAFKSQIGRNIEAYVDDVLLKSQTTSTFLSDLREVLEILRKIRMMLNPKKCIFGVTSGKFLGYLVSRRGIEANPDKVRAI